MVDAESSGSGGCVWKEHTTFCCQLDFTVETEHYRPCCCLDQFFGFELSTSQLPSDLSSLVFGLRVPSPSSSEASVCNGLSCRAVSGSQLLSSSQSGPSCLAVKICFSSGYSCIFEQEGYTVFSRVPSLSVTGPRQ